MADIFNGKDNLLDNFTRPSNAMFLPPTYSSVNCLPEPDESCDFIEIFDPPYGLAGPTEVNYLGGLSGAIVHVVNQEFECQQVCSLFGGGPANVWRITGGWSGVSIAQVARTLDGSTQRIQAAIDNAHAHEELHGLVQQSIVRLGNQEVTRGDFIPYPSQLACTVGSVAALGDIVSLMTSLMDRNRQHCSSEWDGFPIWALVNGQEVTQGFTYQSNVCLDEPIP